MRIYPTPYQKIIVSCYFKSTLLVTSDLKLNAILFNKKTINGERARFYKQVNLINEANQESYYSILTHLRSCVINRFIIPTLVRPSLKCVIISNAHPDFGIRLFLTYFDF